MMTRDATSTLSDSECSYEQTPTSTDSDDVMSVEYESSSENDERKNLETYSKARLSYECTTAMDSVDEAALEKDRTAFLATDLTVKEDMESTKVVIYNVPGRYISIRNSSLFHGVMSPKTSLYDGVVATKVVLSLNVGQIAEYVYMRILDHPGVHRAISCSTDKRSRFEITQPFVRNTTYDIIKMGVVVSDVTLYGWMRQALDVFAYLHSRSVVHCDPKPSNFLLCDDGKLKLTDFELALVLTAGKKITGRSRYTSTLRPPEVWEASERKQVSPAGASVAGAKGGWDQSADIFALGVTFFSWATNKPLIPLQTTDQRYAAALAELSTFLATGEIPPAATCICNLRDFEDLQPDLRSILKSMLASDPHLRPSARELLESKIFLRPATRMASVSEGMLTVDPVRITRTKSASAISSTKTGSVNLATIERTRDELLTKIFPRQEGDAAACQHLAMILHGETEDIDLTIWSVLDRL